MHNWIYHLSPASIIVCLYHVDFDASMIRQRAGVDIRRGCLKRDHILVDQILNLMLEVNAVFSIMSNIVGMISTPLIRSIELRNGIHRFGPHWMDLSGRSQSLVHLCLAFSERSEVPWRFFLMSGLGRDITSFMRRRHLLIISGIWKGRLASVI